MITPVSNFKQSGTKVNLNKFNAKNVAFTSNLEQEFKALIKEAQELGIHVDVDESLKSLTDKIIAYKTPKSLWQRLKDAFNEGAKSRYNNYHHY